MFLLECLSNDVTVMMIRLYRDLGIKLTVNNVGWPLSLHHPYLVRARSVVVTHNRINYSVGVPLLYYFPPSPASLYRFDFF